MFNFAEFEYFLAVSVPFFFRFCHSLVSDRQIHGLRTPGEEIAFTAQPKIQSQSQIFRYSQVKIFEPLIGLPKNLEGHYLGPLPNTTKRAGVL